MAAPGIATRIAYESATYRVEMHIANQLQEILRFLAEDGFVPALKQMPDVPIPPIPLPGRAEEHVLHDLRHGSRSTFQEMMDMVGQEHIGRQATSVACDSRLEPLQIGRRIGRIPTDAPALIAPADDVVAGSRIMNAWCARHAQTLPCALRIVSKSCLTPLVMPDPFVTPL